VTLGELARPQYPIGGAQLFLTDDRRRQRDRGWRQGSSFPCRELGRPEATRYAGMDKTGYRQLLGRSKARGLVADLRWPDRLERPARPVGQQWTTVASRGSS
jgi:hypothetical protein